MEVRKPIEDLCEQLSRESDPEKIRDLSSQLRSSLREHTLSAEGMVLYHFRNQKNFTRKILKPKK